MTAPRFQRQTARGFEQQLTDPLPSTLAALVPDRAQQHGQVASKVAELRGRRVELARQLAEQEAADQQAAAEAAAAGRSPSRRQKAASIRKRLEETETELAGFEEGVAKSADGLLAAAAPFREQALEKATEAQTAAITRAAELLAAADAALDEAGSLVAERSWLARLDGRTRIEPYRPVGGDASLGQLRATLREAFADWQQQHDRRQAEVEQRRAVAAEEEAARVRHEERYRREDAAKRVTTAGGVVVEQGGRPVRQTGFGLQPVEDEEPKP
jgi:hypothetical protein